MYGVLFFSAENFSHISDLFLPIKLKIRDFLTLGWVTITGGTLVEEFQIHPSRCNLYYISW
ncbi:hypothetical protein PJP10_31290, partial [Mycobacterium kansasii]